MREKLIGENPTGINFLGTKIDTPIRYENQTFHVSIDVVSGRKPE